MFLELKFPCVSTRACCGVPIYYFVLMKPTFIAEVLSQSFLTHSNSVYFPARWNNWSTTTQGTFKFILATLSSTTNWQQKWIKRKWATRSRMHWTYFHWYFFRLNELITKWVILMKTITACFSHTHYIWIIHLFYNNHSCPKDMIKQ